MEKQTFLQTLKGVFEELKIDGLVTQEQINNGFEIPIPWFVSKNISRKALIETIRNLHRNNNPKFRGITKKYVEKESRIIYSEKDGIPYIESILGEGAVVIIDQYTPLEKRGDQYRQYLKMVLGSEFVEQILKSKKTLRKIDIINLLRKKGRTRPKEVVKKNAEAFTRGLFDEENMKMELGTIIPEALNEMAVNFRDYYRYLQKLPEPRMNIVSEYGGVVAPRIDTNSAITRTGAGWKSSERLSEIYPFYLRDAMYNEFGPIVIRNYDGYDKKKDDILNGEFTLYIYENPNKQDGYLGISEPFEGDKSTRVFFIPREKIKAKRKDGEDENSFWTRIGKEYISMSRSEFTQEGRTSILKHTGTLEDFRDKIGGILGVKKTTNKDPQHGNIRRIMKKLGFIKTIGKEGCKEIVAEVTEQRLGAAEQAIGPLINPKEEVVEVHE